MPDFEIKGNPTDAGNDKKESKKGNKLINTLKKKPFLVACIAVGLLGLYVWYRNSQNESTHQNMLVADGYDALSLSGASGGGGGSYSTGTYEELSEEFLKEMEKVSNSFQNQISDMQNAFDNTYDEMSGQLGLMSDKINTQENIIEEQAGSIKIQNDVDKMKANSDAWWFVKTDAEKQALANANKQIASQYGWSFNDVDGYWYDSNGSRVYSTVVQSQYSVSVPTTKTASTTQSDIDKMKANSDAWLSAKTDTERNALADANAQIASQYGWTRNDGVWYDVGGNRVYTSDKQKSSSSSSSSSKSSSSSSSKASTAIKNATNNVKSAIASSSSSSKSSSSSSSKSSSSKSNNIGTAGFKAKRGYGVRK